MLSRKTCITRFLILTAISVVVSLSTPARADTGIEPNGFGGRLVGWWTFDQESPFPLNDVSGNGLHAKRHGASEDERRGNATDAIRFDPERHDCVVMSSATIPSSFYTYSLWIRPTSTAANQTVFVVGDQKTPDHLTLRYDGARERVVFHHGAGAVASSDDSVPNGQWTHVAVTRDHGRKLIRLYVNGHKAASVGESADVRIREPSLVLEGRCPAAVDAAAVLEKSTDFAGLIDDLQIYRRLLTSGEVAILHHLTRAGPDALRAVPAGQAQRFVESVGVATHFGYTDRKYYTEFDVIAEKLANLGVTYFRDGIQLSTGWKAMRARQLYDEHGLQVLAGFSIKQSGSRSPLVTDPEAIEAKLDQIISDYMSQGREALLAIEGPNEYELQSRGADPRWSETLRQFQHHLYTTARTKPELANVPVIGPSITSGYLAQAGDYTGLQDASNMHPYPGGASVGNSSIHAHFEAYDEMAKDDGAPWVTETGYHNALGNAEDGDGRISHPGVPEEVEAKYLPRLYMEYFRIGVPRTVAYEFIDELEDPENDDMEANFGLLRYDLSEKPVYIALKNTLAVLSDPGASFTPEPLTYALTGNIANVAQVVLQKRNGDHYLVLWNEVSSYNIPKHWKSGAAGEVLENAAAGVTLRFDSDKRLSAYLPLEGTAGRDLGEGKEFMLQVPDHLLILKIEHLGTGIGN